MENKALDKVYEPQKVEAHWYRWWEERGYFHSDVEPGRPCYCITIPPPNVTGELHMGHALQHAIHDTLIRWKRMQGYNTLCLPGTDHAGIATQMKVEQELFKEGLSRFDLGRKKLVERVWRWREKYGGAILRQFRALGCSYDWRRERFTLDEGYVRAVLEAFVRIHAKGWIYRGKRLVNWCPQCLTVISDLEVEERQVEGHLWHIRYPGLEGGPDVIVATTRPETMLGDTGVAVNPADERWREAVGRQVLLPLMHRPIPIVADAYADPEFGSGAVKVTPAHDPNDFEVGQRHHLPAIEVIGEDATMTAAAGRYAGLDRMACRQAVVRDLQEQGLLVKVEEYSHAVPYHDKCGTIIEPLIKEQWFVAMKPLAQQAVPPIRDGQVRYVPERYRDSSLEWLENIRDWCISRQLWWGHRIPVWYCVTCNQGECPECQRPRLAVKVPPTLDTRGLTEAEILDRSRLEPCLHASYLVSVEPPQVCPECGGTEFQQDSDVLDTWFSSALWPFATLGWPERTPDLEYYHPTDLLITARDILYLWVARMIMTALEFVHEVPFREVFVHPTIQTKDGRRMSKSLGTGIDPLKLMEQYGADATRLALLHWCASTQDVRFDAEVRENELVEPSPTAEMCARFCNKIWNAARFVLSHLEAGEGSRQAAPSSDSAAAAPLSDLPDRWIRSRYQATVEGVTQALESYRFDDAARMLYEFLWSEYCDWYVEMSKEPLSRGDPAQRQAARQVLVEVLEGTLRLLHPMMPFITEELWQKLPHAGDSIMVAPWPQPDPTRRDPAAEAEMEVLMATVRALRNLCADADIKAGREIEVIVQTENPSSRAVLEANAAYVGRLLSYTPRVKLQSFQVTDRRADKPSQALSAAVGDLDLYVPLRGVIDLHQEIERLEKELEKLAQELANTDRKLMDRDFLAKAPAPVVQREREKRRTLFDRKERLTERLRMLSEIAAEP